MAETTNRFLRRATNISLAGCTFFVAVAVLVRANFGDEVKSGAEFRKAWEAAVSFSWSDRELHDGLASLGRSQGVAIFLDRRIDPNQKVVFAASDLPLGEALQSLGKHLRLSVAPLQSVIYIGPEGAAGKLVGTAATRRNELATLSAENRKRWLTPQPFRWDELAEPRGLMETIFGATEVRPENFDDVPHDLWNAFQGPALAPVDQLALLLIGFDRTFTLNAEADTVTLIAPPDKSTYEQTHLVAGDLVRVGKEIKRLFPDLTLQRDDGNRIRVEATAEQHEKIASLSAGNKPSAKNNVKPGEKRYDLTVENKPIGAVMKALADDRKLELKYDPAVKERLQQRISLAAKQLSFDAVMAQALANTDLTYRVEATTLVILAKP